MDDNKKTISEDFLTLARGFLRITVNDTVINTEIKTLIEACQSDLIKNGITSTMAISEEDPLIKMAVFLYLKAEFGLDNKNYEKYRASYEQLRSELSMTGNYISEVVKDVV